MHPEAPATSAGRTQTPEAPKKNEKKKLYMRVGAVAAGVALAAGAVFAVNASNSAPEEKPVAEAPANPGSEAEPAPLSCAEWIEQKVNIPQLGTPEAEALAAQYRIPASTAPENVTQAFMDMRKKQVTDMIALLPKDHDTVMDCIGTYSQDPAALSTAFGLDRLSTIYAGSTFNPNNASYADLEKAMINDYGLIAYNTLSYEEAPVESNVSITEIAISADRVRSEFRQDFVFDESYTIGGVDYSLNLTVNAETGSWVTEPVS